MAGVGGEFMKLREAFPLRGIKPVDEVDHVTVPNPIDQIADGAAENEAHGARP